MRMYGAIPTEFWTNLTLSLLSSDARLLGTYLLTGPHTTMTGCFRLPLGYVAEDLHWELNQVSRAFDELIQSGFIHRDTQTHWLWIPLFLTWNPIINPNQGKAFSKHFETIPTNLPFYTDFIHTLNPYHKHFEIAFLSRLSQLLTNKVPSSSHQTSRSSHIQVADETHSNSGHDDNLTAVAAISEVSPPQRETISLPSFTCSETVSKSIPNNLPMEIIPIPESSPEVFRNQNKNNNQKQDQEQNYHPNQNKQHNLNQIEKQKTKSETGTHQKIICATLPDGNPALVASEISPVDVMSIPLVGKQVFWVAQADIDEWQSLYPAVDILQALRNIRGWNLANPRRRKTQQGIRHHITQWLARLQNQGGRDYSSKPMLPQQSLSEYNQHMAALWLQQSTEEQGGQS